MIYYDKADIRAVLIKTLYDLDDFNCYREFGHSEDSVRFGIDRISDDQKDNNLVTIVIRKTEPGLASQMPIIGQFVFNRYDFADRLETIVYVVDNICSLNNQ